MSEQNNSINSNNIEGHKLAQDKLKKIVSSMLREDIDLKMIQQATGLSVDEITKLKHLI